MTCFECLVCAQLFYKKKTLPIKNPHIPSSSISLSFSVLLTHTHTYCENHCVCFLTTDLGFLFFIYVHLLNKQIDLQSICFILIIGLICITSCLGSRSEPRAVAEEGESSAGP
ncbi:hypothetical protein QVD17_01507 [Tagetes erecta]|uniref:Uncharacterized protein n=1 Tax=Tagetes erecta TaxID=13708 RepID=A0AAD8P6U5_TARER|nr:hypothetical protein QVD17_01507 [Tagetes erecta]